MQCAAGASDWLRPTKTGFMLAWSVVSLLTFLAEDYEHMLVLRFLLGITEAPVSVLSYWWMGAGLTVLKVLPWSTLHDQHVLYEEGNGYAYVYLVHGQHAGQLFLRPHRSADLL